MHVHSLLFFGVVVETGTPCLPARPLLRPNRPSPSRRRRRPLEGPHEVREPRDEEAGQRGRGQRAVQDGYHAHAAHKGQRGLRLVVGSGGGGGLEPERGAGEARHVRLGQQRRRRRLLLPLPLALALAAQGAEEGARRRRCRCLSLAAPVRLLGPLLVLLLLLVVLRRHEGVEVPARETREALAGVHGAEGGHRLLRG